jgi:spermidine/putrescine transport system substrate-binding protein
MRRHHLIFIPVITLGLVVAACGDDDGGGGEALDPDADLSEQTLTISNWDAYMPEDLIPSFEEATGIDVTLALHDTNETIVGKLQASDGEGFDLVFVSGQFAQALNEQGLLAPIDHEFVPNLANLYPEASELEHDPGLAFSVPYTWGTTGLCYRSDLVADEPTSWNAVLQPSDDVRGKITMLRTDRWLMLPAQKALGFSVNTTDADELSQVQDLLVEAKEGLLAYDDTTFYSRLVSGEASLVVAWDGWCNYGIAENADIRFVVPDEGSDLWTDTMVVLSSSANKEAAHAFIDHVLDPANHQAVAELVSYKVPNEAAMAAIDPAVIEQFPNLGMTAAELLAGEQLLDLGEATAEYTRIVTEVTAG